MKHACDVRYSCSMNFNLHALTPDNEQEEYYQLQEQTLTWGGSLVSRVERTV